MGYKKHQNDQGDPDIHSPASVSWMVQHFQDSTWFWRDFVVPETGIEPSNFHPTPRFWINPGFALSWGMHLPLLTSLFCKVQFLPGWPCDLLIIQLSLCDSSDIPWYSILSLSIHIHIHTPWLLNIAMENATNRFFIFTHHYHMIIHDMICHMELIIVWYNGWYEKYPPWCHHNM